MWRPCARVCAQLGMAVWRVCVTLIPTSPTTRPTPGTSCSMTHPTGSQKPRLATVHSLCPSWRDGGGSGGGDSGGVAPVPASPSSSASPISGMLQRCAVSSHCTLTSSRSVWQCPTQYSLSLRPRPCVEPCPAYAHASAGSGRELSGGRRLDRPLLWLPPPSEMFLRSRF